MTDHAERPPNALAHGPVTSGDIERAVRRDVDQSDAHITHDKRTSARRERELSREAELKQDTDS